MLLEHIGAVGAQLGHHHPHAGDGFGHQALEGGAAGRGATSSGGHYAKRLKRRGLSAECRSYLAWQATSDISVGKRGLWTRGNAQTRHSGFLSQ